VLVAANIMFAKRSTRSTRLAAGVVLILLEIYLLGQATRTFSVFFVLVFVGGWLTGRWSNRQSILIGVGAALIALITLGLPLTLRGLPQHGLLPSLQYLAASPGEAFSGDSNPLYNALLGVPLSMYEFTQIPPIGTRALWVSLNPLPGGSSGWTKLAPDLRLNQYEPFSAIGEVLNHGWRVALLVAAALGAVLQLLAAVARSTPGRWGSAAYALILGIAGLILIRCTQYNLRTSARLIYFLVFAVTALAVVGHVLAGQRRSRPSVSTEVVSRGDQPQVSA
jgi:hypothetical protein